MDSAGLYSELALTPAENPEQIKSCFSRMLWMNVPPGLPPQSLHVFAATVQGCLGLNGLRGCGDEGELSHMIWPVLKDMTLFEY